MSVLPILLLIFFFVIIGVVLSSTYPTSIYEKQEKEYFKRQKNYYKNINRLIKKYTKYVNGKGKPLSADDLKTLKRYVINDIKDNPDSNMKILYEYIEKEDSLDYSDDLLASFFNDEKDKNSNNINSYNLQFEDIDYTKYNAKSNSKRKISDKLYKYCECLTDKKYEYNPAIGREKELEELMISILTPNKSSIILGNSGVGKTSLVEGLAYNLQRNNVPDALKDYVILQTSAAVLNSNCSLNGMLEKRVIELFNLLKEEKNVILFIDEIHTFIGTGKSFDHNSLDIANIIKPFIVSDDVILVGATTNLEYNEFISSDKAFERRFQIINIDEPKDKNLLNIIQYTIKKYSKIYNVKVKEDILNNVSYQLLNLTSKDYRNINNKSYNPDLVISIISKAFGYARLYNLKEITINEFAKAYNTSNKVKGAFKCIKQTNISNKIIHVKF